jgi:pSer/pThr/pTyr-binding forkhead associated (FHA) protein
MDFGSSDEESRTVIMGGGMDYGSTMILGSEQGSGQQTFNHVVKIIRRRTGQSMVINKDLFRIGSEASFVDLFLGDNPAIGSCHANICERDGAYYIADQNSVNHTYVNGVIVQPGELVQLVSGNLITLADEDFDFIIS